MAWLSRLVFGNVRFEASEEYQEFQFKFLCVVILAGALITGLLVLGSHATVNRIDPAHVRSMHIFTAGSLVFWLLLRGRKAWFLPLAWPYEMFCLLEYASALYYVSEDELRVVWFLTNIPGVYLLLGQGPGLVVTALTAIGLAVGNGYLPSPYSPNALATLLACIIFLGLFFHIYGNRSISYFRRLQDSNRQLYQLAMHDPLTGVLNARAYYQSGDQLIQIAQRAARTYAVLFIDLDHFKSVNDTYGHAAGDLVLQAAAGCIRQNLRSSDVVGRVGGEEFSIFLPDTEMEAACGVAENIRQAIEALRVNVEPGVSLRISASIGVAGSAGRASTLKDIQQEADSVMYHAKKAGRNRVSRFDGALALGL